MPSRKAVSLAITLLLCAEIRVSATVLAGDPPQPAPTPAELPSLRITLPDRVAPELNRAKDLRWASDDSIYLALGADGVSEVNLNPPSQQITAVTPTLLKG